MQVQSLGQEDPLEEGMAIHSTILAWRIPWTETPRGLQFTGSQRSRTQLSDWACQYHGVDEFCAWPPTGLQPKFSGNNLQTSKELASTLILTWVYFLKSRVACWKESDSKDSVYCCEVHSCKSGTRISVVDVSGFSGDQAWGLGQVSESKLSFWFCSFHTCPLCRSRFYPLLKTKFIFSLFQMVFFDPVKPQPSHPQQDSHGTSSPKYYKVIILQLK